MRVALFVAIFVTLALIAAWFIARSIVRRGERGSRIEELESENKALSSQLEQRRRGSSARRK